MQNQKTAQNFISENWKLLLFPFSVLLFLIIKRSRTKAVHLESEGAKIAGSNERLQTIARNVSIYLGYAYPIYDPRRAFEQDEKTFNEIRFLTRSELITVSEIYFRVYAKGRDLKSDLAKNLDTEYFEQLNNL